MDLDRVVETIKLAVDLQLKRINDGFTMKMSSQSVHLRPSVVPILPPLIYQSVSRYALNLIAN